MSIDLVRKARETKNILLVACDIDFVPAIIDIREKDKANVILHYFKVRHPKFSMSDHILTVCDKIVKIKMDDFKKAEF